MDRERKSRSATRRPKLIVVVLILFVGLGMHARREYYRQLALSHRKFIASELQNRNWRRTWPGGFTRRGWIEHERAMAKEYERIANYPWLPFKPPVPWHFERDDDGRR